MMYKTVWLTLLNLEKSISMILLGPGCSIFRSVGTNNSNLYLNFVGFVRCVMKLWSHWGYFLPHHQPRLPGTLYPSQLATPSGVWSNVQCMKALYTLFIPFVQLPIRKATGWELMQFRSWRRRPCGRWIEEDGTRCFPHIPCSDKSGPVHINGAITFELGYADNSFMRSWGAQARP